MRDVRDVRDVCDVRAYLAGHPVRARPAPWRSVSGRCSARHRVPATAAALAVLSLMTGLRIALRQAQQACLGRDEARRRLADVHGVTHELAFCFSDGIACLRSSMNVKTGLLNATLAQLPRLNGSSGGLNGSDGSDGG